MPIDQRDWVSSPAVVTGTTLVSFSQCHNCVAGIALPFAYNFYGQQFTGVNASSNGNLQFSSSSSTNPDAKVQSPSSVLSPQSSVLI